MQDKLEIYEIKEEDFYPPSDDRTWRSYVVDVDSYNTFEDYCIDFFQLLDEEEYFD